MNHHKKIIVTVGFPASGKSTYAEKLKSKLIDSIVVSCNDNGVKIQDLIPIVKNYLESRRNVIIDKTHNKG